LFAYAVGYAKLVRKYPDHLVVAALDRVFGLFDRLAAACHVTKVETIESTWLGVAGALEPTLMHAECACNMAVLMQKMIHDFTEAGEFRVNPDDPDDPESIQIKIGLHSGAITAGTVGARTPAWK